LPTRTTKAIFPRATVRALIIDAGVPFGARVIVTATFNTRSVRTDPAVSAVAVLDASIDAHAQLVSLSSFAILTDVALFGRATLVDATTVGADVVHGTFGVQTTAVLAAVVDARLSLRTFVVDSTTRRTLVFLITKLSLRASLIITAARNTQPIIVANLPYFARLVAATAVGALAGSTDLVFRTASGLNTTGNTEVISAQLT